MLGLHTEEKNDHRHVERFTLRFPAVNPCISLVPLPFTSWVPYFPFPSIFVNIQQLFIMKVGGIRTVCFCVFVLLSFYDPHVIGELR